jgi:hypothetical protein
MTKVRIRAEDPLPPTAYWSNRIMKAIELDPPLRWSDFEFFSLGALHLMDPNKVPHALQKSHWRCTRSTTLTVLPFSTGRQHLHIYLHAQLFGHPPTQLRRCVFCIARNCVNPFHWTTSPSGTASVPLPQGSAPIDVAEPEPSDEDLLRETIERQVLQMGNKSITALAAMLDGMFTREDILRIVNSDRLLKQEVTE